MTLVLVPSCKKHAAGEIRVKSELLICIVILAQGHRYSWSQKNTKHYELLNYSEHGTTVDNVLYSCDFSEKILPTPPSSIVAKVQNVISKLSHKVLFFAYNSIGIM
ncbi:hypothetical protein AB205_0060260 [Aquarana catesbeiana]|uniref:Uncharacterized protein n=1 Tax=Aquarana catesbeiana TaxID=8400 RepID=A0A2G9SL30_AQUCT|nr:hypothetical protein AB205_0060260 [Aquarana catesbeiana]